MVKLHILACLSFFAVHLNSQTTVGLLQHSQQSLDDGYVLFAPMSSTNTYLIDKCGRQIKQWSSLYSPALSVYLNEDGTILRPGRIGNTLFNAGGYGGIIEKYDWDGYVIWSYVFSDDNQCQHHDVRQMPNGNILVMSWESKTAAEAIAQGRNPSLTSATVWSEKVVELQPVGTNEATIVWEWHAWDHLVQDFDTTKPNYAVVAENSGLINLNYRALANTEDWLHVNSIDYNESLDQIMLSSHSFGEVWILDHSTSSAEAAASSGGNSGKGGDLIYRWGNPLAYNQGTVNDRKFWGQHNAHWIDADLPFGDQIMVYNNGTGRTGGNYTTVEIINPPVEGFGYAQTLPFAPSDQSWMYNEGNTHTYYAQNISGAQQLSNGNVLMCNGPAGNFTEVDTDGITVWEYVNPVGNGGVMNQGANPTANLVFRCSFYPIDYSGFQNHTLSAGIIIENSNPNSAACSLMTSLEDYSEKDILEIYPNPANSIVHLNLKNQAFITKVEIISSDGRLVYQENMNQLNLSIPIEHLASGVYFTKVSLHDKVFVNKLIIQH